MRAVDRFFCDWGVNRTVFGVGAVLRRRIGYFPAAESCAASQPPPSAAIRATVATKRFC